jgi:hypothetical protein
VAGAFDIFTRLNLHGASKTNSASILTSSFFQYMVLGPLKELWHLFKKNK